MLMYLISRGIIKVLGIKYLSALETGGCNNIASRLAENYHVIFSLFYSYFENMSPHGQYSVALSI
jgi:hypothetical protein